MKKSNFYIVNIITNETKDEVYSDFNKAIDDFVEMFGIKDLKLNIDYTVKQKIDTGKVIYYDLGLENWKIVQKIGE